MYIICNAPKLLHLVLDDKILRSWMFKFIQQSEMLKLLKMRTNITWRSHVIFCRQTVVFCFATGMSSVMLMWILLPGIYTSRTTLSTDAYEYKLSLYHGTSLRINAL